MIRRREFVVGFGALGVAACSGLAPACAAAQGRLRVAAVQFGSLSWLLDTIKAQNLDREMGVSLDVRPVASNQAATIALLAGEADIVVSDWTWAMRQRSMGRTFKFAPYSSALGAVMVAKDSPIRALGDLAGQRLGVAGSAIDKSWLLLRAYSRKILGRDIADISIPVFGAPPLITEEMKNGRIAAVLNFWTYAARLAGQGFVELLSMADILRALDVAPTPCFVGYIWNEKAPPETLAAIPFFLEAARKANAVLAEQNPAWERLRPLVKPASEEEFAAIRAGYRAGIPQPWTEAHTQAAQKLMGLLLELGDEDLMGANTKFDANLFHATS